MFKCKVCSRTFSRNWNLERHLLTHKNEKPFQCHFCDKSFGEKEKWTKHCLKHTNVSSEELCHVLVKVEQSDSDICNESSRKEGSEDDCILSNKMECDACETTFDSESDLQNHTCKVTNEDTLVGDMNLEDSSTANTSSENTNKKSYVCKLCKREFTSGVRLMKHYHIHLNKKQKRYNCEACFRTFPRRYNLERHLLTHTGERPFQCEICNKSFAEKNKLAAHSQTHKNESSAEFGHVAVKVEPLDSDACDESSCKEASENDYILPNKIECDANETTFDSESDSQNHTCKVTNEDTRVGDMNHEDSSTADTSSENTNKKSLVCNICSQVFTNRVRLLKHYLIHSLNLKKARLKPGRVRQQQRLVHSNKNQKHFKCEACSRTFPRRFNLERHLLTHTGEKPFQCDICNKSFTEKAKLTAHSRTHKNKSLAELAHVDVKVDQLDSDVCDESSCKEASDDYISSNKIECDACDTPFDSESDLQNHSCKLTNEDAIVYDLNHEDSSAADTSSENINNKSLVCNICNKAFTSDIGLIKHCDIHSNELNLKCETCSKTFPRRYNLERHLLTHTSESSFQCNICNVSFNEKDKLTAHNRIHENVNLVDPDHEFIINNQFDSGVCSELPCEEASEEDSPNKLVYDTSKKSFNEKVVLQTHGCGNTTEKAFEHDLNHEDASAADTFSENTNEKSFVCNVCSEVFSNEILLNLHYRGVHPNRKLFGCEICSKTFSRKFNLERHVLTHTKEKPVQCDIYNKSFAEKGKLTLPSLTRINESSAELSRKVMNVDKFDSDIYNESSCKEASENYHFSSSKIECDACKLNFDGSADLQKHHCTATNEEALDRHRDTSEADVSAENADNESSECKTGSKSSSQKSFLCNICNKTFRNNGAYTLHRRAHTNAKSYSCDVCGSTFRKKDSLKKHLLNHSNEKPFVCELCGKCFKQMGSLVRHCTIHTNEKLFECHLCTKSFYDKDSLQRHLKTHANHKPIVCDICGREFLRRACLVKHYHTHMCNKHFVCDVCGQSFSSESALNEHANRKRFVCEMCNKIFCDKIQLKKHSFSHTNEKPYVCEVCKKGFMDRNTLRKHKFVHMTDKRFACELCNRSFTYKCAWKKHIEKFCPIAFKKIG